MILPYVLYPTQTVENAYQIYPVAELRRWPYKGIWARNGVCDCAGDGNDSKDTMFTDIRVVARTRRAWLIILKKTSSERLAGKVGDLFRTVGNSLRSSTVAMPICEPYADREWRQIAILPWLCVLRCAISRAETELALPCPAFQDPEDYKTPRWCTQVSGN